MRRAAFRAVLFAGAFLSSTNTNAAYEEGVTALRSGNHAVAFEELRNALDASDQRAAGPLAVLLLHGRGVKSDPVEAYRLAKIGIDADDVFALNAGAEILIRGLGTDANIDLGRSWAKRSAARRDANGQYLVYLGYLLDPKYSVSANRGLTYEQYIQMAARPVSERQEEIEALENMAKAADQNLIVALTALAAHFADKIGPYNHVRARQLYVHIPSLPDPLNFKTWLHKIGERGETRVTPKLMRNAQTSALVTAAAKVKKPECKDITLEKLELLGTIGSPIYLPLTHPALRESYLIGGEWQEIWTYSFCGVRTKVRGTFRADGMSGAHYVFSAQ